MKHIDSQKKSVLFPVVVVLSFVTVILIIFLITLPITTKNNVTDFQSCKDAGGAILESYPEQCLLDGRTFVNESQLSKESHYVGLSEQAAMDKAKTAGVRARVVERDNESLAVTMDYVVGRLNFHVRDGHVYKVDVEGVE